MRVVILRREKENVKAQEQEENPPMSETIQREQMRNILLRLAYDGTEFFGWQVQPARPTIQGVLAAAFRRTCGEEVAVCGAGRTDAGVHACEQAANVRLAAPIPCPNLVQAVNDHLPESIRMLSAQEVSPQFHARRDARSKIYRYQIYREPVCPPWLSRYVCPVPYVLEEQAMQQAAPYFEGTKDFRSFASAEHSQDREQRSSVRTVFSSVVTREGANLTYTIEGNGFLHHMVRNIVGTLLLVGRKKIAPQAIPEILAAASRSAAGPTAPARGLHLVRVFYPDELLRNPALDNEGNPGRIQEKIGPDADEVS